MTFLGLLVFFDPPKAGVIEALDDLRKLGITLKLITGDNVHVATSVTRNILGYEPKVLTGTEVHSLSDDALRSRANVIDVFAEIEPSQKERIILALRKSGNTVGSSATVSTTLRHFTHLTWEFQLTALWTGPKKPRR